MIENLKIALKRQRKLIALFLLTIFLPSLALGIFGVQAIRNEHFRLAKQVEEKHQKFAESIKEQIYSSLRAIETVLQENCRYTAFDDKEYQTITNLLNDQFAENSLISQAFVAYENGDIFFPLFPGSHNKYIPRNLAPLTSVQKEKLSRAEEFEFVQKNYNRAIALYNDLLSSTKDKNFRAMILNCIARNIIKLKQYKKAIEKYEQILQLYPDSYTDSGIPQALIAKLQIIDCYLKLGESSRALENALDLYSDLLEKPWGLSEDQFTMYAAMVKDIISKFSPEDTDIQRFERYQVLHEERKRQYREIEIIKEKIIPDIFEQNLLSDTTQEKFIYFSKNIEDENYLVLADAVFQNNQYKILCILGVVLNNNYFEEELLTSIITDINVEQNIQIVISDFNGDVVWGEKTTSSEALTTTTFFEDNFPPWKIEVYRSGGSGFGLQGIYTSYYFWTILTLLLILTFGAFLIVRTVAHDMDVMKAKSDFVSSVSHEFKTPLTSIKALTERLLEGKVTNQEKMNQYFSVIAQDIEKLTRLVRNVLDFSKIEEGKIEYNFESTNIAEWLRSTVDEYKRDPMLREVTIHTHISNNIPSLPIDRDAMAQAITNLLDNAVKFSHATKEIHVYAENVEGAAVIIKIQDNGIGITQDEVGKIFEKFFQGQSAQKQSVKGTGLGLTLVKHAVEAHGGTITVESKEGKGSTFTIKIPNNK